MITVRQCSTADIDYKYEQQELVNYLESGDYVADNVHLTVSCSKLLLVETRDSRALGIATYYTYQKMSLHQNNYVLI